MAKKPKKSKKAKKKKLSSTKINLLFIWNTYPFADVLAKHFGKQNVVKSEDELNEFDFSNVTLIIILAELNWDGRKLSEFYGIEILKKLRLEKRLLIPAIVCSFLSKDYFLAQSFKGKNDILKTPGHLFRQLPFDINEIKNISIQPLDEETLDDIVESFCNIEGKFNEEIHKLKNTFIISNDKKIKPPDELRGILIDALETSTERLLNLFDNDNRLTEAKKSVIKEINSLITAQENYDRAIELISIFESQLRQLLPAQEQQSTFLQVEEPKWKVIFVDDEEQICQRVRKEFEDRNIVCETASNASEVFKLLDNDVRTNWSTALIADYRLLKPDGDLQDIQGYSILKRVYLDKPNFLAYFALTAAHRKALLRIQRTYQMRVFTYSKEDILSSSGAFNMFADKVREEAEKIYDAVCSQPQLTSWQEKSNKNIEPLKNYYRAHRAAIDYENSEKCINEQAKNFVDRTLEAFDNGGDAPSHNYEFQAELKEGPKNIECLKKFRQRLIGRRIAIGLYIWGGFTRERIFYAMKKNPVLDIDAIPVNERPTKKSIDALLNTALALSIDDDIPNNLLVEERDWLKNTMNIDLDENNQTAYQEIEYIIDNIKTDLKRKRCVDDFVNENTSITNFETARNAIERAKELAEQNGLSVKLKDLLNECWDKAQPSVEQAFRSSGVYFLIKPFIQESRVNSDYSDYIIGREE